MDIHKDFFNHFYSILGDFNESEAPQKNAYEATETHFIETAGGRRFKNYTVFKSVKCRQRKRYNFK